MARAQPEKIARIDVAHQHLFAVRRDLRHLQAAVQQHEEVRGRLALMERRPRVQPAGWREQRGLQSRIGQGPEQVQVAQEGMAQGRGHRGPSGSRWARFHGGIAPCADNARRARPARSLRYSKEGAARVAFNESAGSNGC